MWTNRREQIQEAIQWARAEFSDYTAECQVQIALASLGPGEPERKAKMTRIAIAADDPLAKAIVAWRGKTANAEKKKLFHVLHNRTVAALAEQRPLSLDAMRSIDGLGPWKIKHYGPDLLRIIQEHGDPASVTPKPKGPLHETMSIIRAALRRKPHTEAELREKAAEPEKVPAVLDKLVASGALRESKGVYRLKGVKSDS